MRQLNNLYREGRGAEHNSRNMSVKWERGVEMAYDHTRQAIGRLCMIARPDIPHLFRLNVFYAFACHGHHEDYKQT